jgi:hypothetical protein
MVPSSIQATLVLPPYRADIDTVPLSHKLEQLLVVHTPFLDLEEISQ